MDRPVDRTELHHIHTVGGNEAPVGGAAAGGKLGLASGLFEHGPGDRFRQRTLGGQKRTPDIAPIDVAVDVEPRQQRFDVPDQRVLGPLRGVPEIEAAREFSRYHVGGAGVAVDIDHLKAAGREVPVALVQGFEIDGADEIRQIVYRVPGLLRVGDMSLYSAQRHQSGQAAAAAHANGIAKDFGAGGFSDDAPVYSFAPPVQLFHHPERSVARFPFLIAGDQERDGTGMVGIGAHKALTGHGHRGQTGLHVRSAACDQSAIGNLPCKGIDRPFRLRTGRHHIRMAGKAQQGAGVAPARPQIVHLAKSHGLHPESRRIQDRPEQRLAPAVRGSHGLHPDQVARQVH